MYFRLFPTWLSRWQILCHVLCSVPDMIVPGDVHVDETEEGAALDPEALGTLATGVKAAWKY